MEVIIMTPTRLSIGAGDRERSRCERAAYWWFASGPTAGPPTLALYIGVESAPRHMLYKKTSWLREVSLEYVVCSTGCQYCRYSKRDELGSVDEPSRSAAEGRSSEGLVRTVVKGIRLTRSQGNRKTSAREIAIHKSFWTPIAAHAVEDTPDPPLTIQSTYLWAGRTIVWSIRT
ncbi:hypothetical protein T07_5651 [Trichinella nelsoni]|uniref:Uncharacterized protein n=1 Tax=Trichinella nelsoni TaxID=6336 RepID=A0A0V0RNA1_9BILA|nr:hypothetical protein T07_5651 [Trichinella nelsoni]